MADGLRAKQRIFLSYAHGDPAHEALVQRLYRLLRMNDISVTFDLPATARRQSWVDWTVKGIREADRVLVLASTAYRERFESTCPADEGRGVRQEARLIQDEMYKDQEAGRVKFVPVLLPGSVVDDIPLILEPYSAMHYRVDEFTVAGAEDLIRLLTDQPAWVEPETGTVPTLPPREWGAVAVARLVVDGATPAVADRLVRAAIRRPTAAGASTRAVFGLHGIATGAVLITAAHDPGDGLSQGLSDLHREAAAMGEPGLRVRVGLDLDRTTSGRLDAVAERLAQCRAARTMHLARGAVVVVVASPAFHARIDDVAGYPMASTFGEWPEEEPDGPRCWISVPPLGACPRMPQPDTDRRVPRAGPVASRYAIDQHGDGIVNVVEMGDHGSMHIGDNHYYRGRPR